MKIINESSVKFGPLEIKGVAAIVAVFLFAALAVYAIESGVVNEADLEDGIQRVIEPSRSETKGK